MGRQYMYIYIYVYIYICMYMYMYMFMYMYMYMYMYIYIYIYYIFTYIHVYIYIYGAMSYPLLSSYIYIYICIYIYTYTRYINTDTYTYVRLYSHREGEVGRRMFQPYIGYVSVYIGRRIFGATSAKKKGLECPNPKSSSAHWCACPQHQSRLMRSEICMILAFRKLITVFGRGPDFQILNTALIQP